MRSLWWTGLMLCFLSFVTLSSPQPTGAGQSSPLPAQQQTETDTSQKAEFGRFFINTTVGLGGIGNVAQRYPSLNPSREDLGQTFGAWGFDSGAYLMLPFLGPSSFRDGLGRLGETFIDPIWWVPVEIRTSVAIRAGEAVNDTSLDRGLRSAEGSRLRSLHRHLQCVCPEPQQIDRRMKIKSASLEERAFGTRGAAYRP